MPLCTKAYAEGKVYAVEHATNINAIVHGLKDFKTQSTALSSLDEMVKKWGGTNYDVFSTAVDGLMSMIGWGGMGRRQAPV